MGFESVGEGVEGSEEDDQGGESREGSCLTLSRTF